MIHDLAHARQIDMQTTCTSTNLCNDNCGRGNNTNYRGYPNIVYTIRPEEANGYFWDATGVSKASLSQITLVCGSKERAVNFGFSFVEVFVGARRIKSHFHLS